MNLIISSDLICITSYLFIQDISLQMNDVIAKMVEEDPESEDGKRKVQKLVDRDVKKLRNDVERQVSQCKQDCPSECDSCGSAKIEELKLKLQVFIFILITRH